MTACRYHVYEIVLGRAAREIFGASTGPKVEFFDILKNNWQTLDLRNCPDCNWRKYLPGRRMDGKNTSW